MIRKEEEKKLFQSCRKVAFVSGYFYCFLSEELKTKHIACYGILELNILKVLENLRFGLTSFKKMFLLFLFLIVSVDVIQSTY